MITCRHLQRFILHETTTSDITRSIFIRHCSLAVIVESKLSFSAANSVLQVKCI